VESAACVPVKVVAGEIRLLQQSGILKAEYNAKTGWYEIFLANWSVLQTFFYASGEVLRRYLQPQKQQRK